MGRDEELQQAAKSYASKMCVFCLDEYCKEKGLDCPQFRESLRAFSEGAKWSDEHPRNVWHNVTEEPAGRDWRILCEDESGNSWVANRRDAFTIGYNWKEFAEDKALTRWAYISDLLPKGGE